VNSEMGRICSDLFLEITARVINEQTNQPTNKHA